MDTRIKFIQREKVNLNKVKELTSFDIIKSIYYWNNI